MNYIKLINAFYDRLETNSLSTSAIALWHALVHVNNKAGWQREFTVAVSVLCVKTGLSERTITNARNDLKIKGFLDFKSRKGSKSAVYKLSDLSANIAHKVSDNEDLSEIDADNLSGNPSCNVSDNLSCNPSALIKQNKTKENKTEKEDDKELPINPFSFYEQNGFGVIGAYISQKISMWCDDLSDELVIEAMKLAVERGALNFSYVEKILQEWFVKGIDSSDQARASALAFKDQQSKQRSKPRQGNSADRKEQLPDWFRKQKSQFSSQTENEIDDLDFERQKAELQKELKKYKEVKPRVSEEERNAELDRLGIM
ncbi:DnaD domain protein [Mesobacillus zeae]|uniref:DnaD domain protein n=1 Tax=Mesobacillus zeae TaxID=1917180 RepID=UPI0015E62FE9|nr:DnaD domain protein [Mesobacillus zeae]